MKAPERSLRRSVAPRPFSLLVFTLSVALWAILAPAAMAYCSAPSMYDSPPDAPGTYNRPDPPYCLSEYSITRRHTCDQWELDNFISEINDYIDQLNSFANEARYFADEAIRFANDAADYANCEASDVKSELE